MKASTRINKPSYDPVQNVGMSSIIQEVQRQLMREAAEKKDSK